MIRSFRVAAAASLLVISSVSQAAAPSCQITFRIGTSTPLLTASVFAIYQNAPGDFPGNYTSVSCSLLNGTLGQISDGDQTRTLTLTAIGTPTPINGPKDFAKCTWTPTTRFPTTGDFNLNSQSGSNTSFQPVNANITISKIDCTGTITSTTTTTTTTSTTTTSSSTTTTLPPQLCGDFDKNGKLQTSDALNVLKASIGQIACALCVCDIDGNGVKSATDALITLKKAIGVSITAKCPVCS